MTQFTRNNKTRVTVCLCAYNHEQYIDQALDCLANQTYDHFKIVACDDGSTDGTYRILKEYESGALAGRMIVITHPGHINKGIYHSYNLCLDYVDTEYFMGHGSDDFLDLNAIEYLVALMDAHPDTDVLYGPIKCVDQKGAFLHQLYGTRDIGLGFQALNLLIDFNQICEPSVFYRYSCLTIKSDFIKAWRKSRDAAAFAIESPTPPPKPSQVYKPLATPLKTAQRLEEVMAGLIQGKLEDLKQELGIWVKKFEVSKRLFDEYDNNFKPLTKNEYHNLNSYLRYAEIMELFYTKNSDLPCLNVLLKVLDTLIAHKNELSWDNQARLAWLLARESGHIESLAGINGLKI